MTNKALFVKAFEEADLIEIKPYLSADGFSCSFSQAFENKMNKLIKKDKRISLYTRRRLSRALIAAIIATLIMLTGLMSVSASREKIVEFVETVFSDHTEVQLSDESPETLETIEKEYVLSSVPEGFEQVQYDVEETYVFTAWENGEGQQITLSQMILDGSFSVDSEHNYEKFEMNGYEAYISSNDNDTMIAWSDGEYWYNLYAPKEYEEILLKTIKK